MYDNTLHTPLYNLRYTTNDNEFYIKRDDLLPFSFGGNKVRIAKEYFTDLIEKGYDSIIAYGNSKSNLSRIIANYSKAIGINCYIISSISDSEDVLETYNRQIVENLNAEIITCTKDKVSETVDLVMQECKLKGLNPYYINGDKYGKGNEKVSVHAYVKAYDEIKKFENENNIFFDYIFHASGTGTTQSGLICGKRKHQDKRQIVGISIARKKNEGIKSIRNNILSYFDNNFKIDVKDIIFTDKYNCNGYGNFNHKIDETIDLVLSKDGIPFDRTYTGKAFWGMTEYIKEKKIKNKNILFIHTGGTPLFFDDMFNKKEGEK